MVGCYYWRSFKIVKCFLYERVSLSLFLFYNQLPKVDTVSIHDEIMGEIYSANIFLHNVPALRIYRVIIQSSCSNTSIPSSITGTYTYSSGWITISTIRVVSMSGFMMVPYFLTKCGPSYWRQRANSCCICWNSPGVLFYFTST